MSYIISVETLNESLFKERIDECGYLVVKDMIDLSLVGRLKKQLEICIQKESKFHQTTQFQEYGMLLCCPIYGGSFLELAEHKMFMQPFNWILGDTSIIHVYTSSSIPPNQTNYASRIHVDRPHHTGQYYEALGSLILLDDFTKDNGGTWILPHSHKQIDAPSKDFFLKNAIQIEAPKGSVLYFNLRLWHAGGKNNTDNWRHSIGIGMSRAYIKQRIDIPRALKNNQMENLSAFGLQKLGFFSQPPTSIEEYYMPLGKRSYKQKSEWEIAEDFYNRNI